MRKNSRLFAVLLLTFGLLSACEDPSNVGIGLVGETEGGPQGLTVQPDTFATLPGEAEETGGYSRVLAGTVADPVMGTITATGHMDFVPTGATTDKFKAGPTTSAELRLRRDYMYGDTLGTVTLRVREITEAWIPSDLRADSVFAQGTVVTEFTFTARDTLVVVPLPASWVTTNDAKLRDPDFRNKFFGFEFESVSGNTVVGFNARSIFRVVAGTDTTNYGSNERHTTIQRSGEINPPAGYIPVQDGLGPYVKMHFDFDDVAARNTAVNRFAIVLKPDQAVNAQNAPANFYRPQLKTLMLNVFTSDSLKTQFQPLAALDSRGRFVISYRRVDLLVQDELKDEGLDIWRFEVLPGDNENTLNVAFFPDLSAPQGGPAAEITFTPTVQ